MGPPDSYNTRPASGTRSGLRGLVRLAAGRSPDHSTTGGLAALLLPMVSRTLRTDRGPAALVRWVRRGVRVRSPGAGPDGLARDLTDDLVRLLLAPASPHAETLADDGRRDRTRGG